MTFEFLPILFLLTAAVTIAMALGTVMARNLFHAALFLVGVFAGVAVLYVLLEAEFVAVSQMIIYIGAISTLIIFAIMLTRSVMGTAAAAFNKYVLLTGAAAVALFAILAWLLTTVKFNIDPQPVPDDMIAQIGEGFVSFYVIPFEVASVMLLVALVGAIMLARERH